MFSGDSLAGDAVPEFTLVDGPTATPVPGARGGVYADPQASQYLWGTRIGGDAYTGTLSSVSFRLEQDYLYVPIIGYPNAVGNALTLELLGEGGQASTKLATFAGDNPTEQVALWKIDVSTARGRQARLSLVDGQTEAKGWLGVGAPIVSARNRDATITPPLRTSTYGLFFVAALTVFVLLVLPGYALRVLWPRSIWRATELLPIPGLLSLATLGLLVWCTRSGLNPWFGRVYVGANLLLAAWLSLRKPTAQDDVAIERAPRLAVALWLLTALSAFASGLNPLPVAQEFFAGTTLASRMVASPPDSATPYQTAVYFFHGKDGLQDAGSYFGNWSTTSRGPLVALASTGLLNIFHETPGDPPGFDAQHWPVASDGAYLARILGWLCNAGVLLGASRLLRALGVSPLAYRGALVWLSLSPLVLINTVFLWPKLQTVMFLLLSVSFIVEQRYLGAGGWMALAWLSHPVGALYLPVVGLFVGHIEWAAAAKQAPVPLRLKARAAVLAMARFAGMVLLVMAPWLAFKVYLHQPDALLDIPLGYGNGYVRAPDLTSWATTRWRNIWYTLAPLGFFQSELMPFWLHGPLSQPLRWTIQYAKTLPGQLGFSMLWPAYGALFGKQPAETALRLLRAYLLYGAFALMILFWGYSDDGLGRNSLEPLTALALVFVVAHRPRSARLPLLALVGVWLEGRYVDLSGTILADGFRWAVVTPATWACWSVSALAGALALLLLRPPNRAAA